MNRMTPACRVLAGVGLMAVALVGCGRSPEMVSTSTQETTRTMASPPPMMPAVAPMSSSTTTTRTMTR